MSCEYIEFHYKDGKITRLVERGVATDYTENTDFIELPKIYIP